MDKNGSKKSILIADDEADVLTLMKSMLRNEGYDAITCINGENILDMVIHENPDIILLDITMPAKNGGEICHELKANPLTRNIPLVLFSANDDIERITQECGANGYLLKPFDLGQSRKLFNALLQPDTAVNETSMQQNN